MSWFSRLWRRPAAPPAPDASPDASAFRARGRGHLTADAAPYALPNELSEMQRLDLQHFMLREIQRGNFVAPITRPRRVLDIGCGTGRWGYEMARQFPDATVIGVDVVEPQRPFREDGEPAAPNYHFQVANVLQGLPFADNYFDYIHMRLLVSAIPAAKWPDVACEVARLLTPGGSVESLEVTTPDGCGPNVQAVMDYGRQAILARGVDLSLGARVDQFLRDAGLTVSASSAPIPVGAYGGKIGTLLATDILLAIRNSERFIVMSGLTTAEHYATLVEGAETDLFGTTYRGTNTQYTVIGQKPG